MTRAETDKLFALMEELFIPEKRAATEKRRAAWYLALEKQRYEDVRSAVLRVSLEKKYFPELADLGPHLPAPPPEQKAAAPAGAAEADEDQWACQWWQQRQADLKQKGLPTALEARERGINTRAYMHLLEEQGL